MEAWHAWPVLGVGRLPGRLLGWLAGPCARCWSDAEGDAPFPASSGAICAPPFAVAMTDGCRASSLYGRWTAPPERLMGLAPSTFQSAVVLPSASFHGARGDAGCGVFLSRRPSRFPTRQTSRPVGKVRFHPVRNQCSAARRMWAFNSAIAGEGA